MPEQNQHPTEQAVRDAVARILGSRGFSTSPRLGEFLRFVADETLAGRAPELKEYVIGVSVYRKDETYNPANDSTVRTEASRLRTRLRAYYDAEGVSDPFRIEMPKGGYGLQWKVESEAAPIEPMALKPPVAAPSSAAAVPRSLPARRLAWLIPALLGSLLTGGLLWWLLRAPDQAIAPKVRPFTTLRGGEYEPVFSPDGRRVAFTWNGEAQDNYDIYVAELSGGRPRRVTNKPGGEASPCWSPDGKQLAYLSSSEGRRDAAIFVTDLESGSERRVSSTKLFGALHDRHLDWSSDGQWLAVADRDAEGQPYFIDLIALSDGRRRRLTTPSGQTLGDTGPAFSPDGQTLAFRRASSDAVREIFLVPVSGGKPRALTQDHRHIPAHAWAADGKSLLFVSNRDEATRIWRIGLASGAKPAGPLPYGQDAYHLAVSRQTKHVIFSQLVQQSNIWRVNLRQPERNQVFIDSTRRDASAQFSPAGDRVAFRSDRTGSHEIWLWENNGAVVRPLTNFRGPLTGSPRWAPDAQRIAFDSRPQGHSDIFTIPSPGGEPVRVTTHSADDVLPCYSVDGRWIFFASNRSGTWQVWKLPAGVVESAQSPAKQVTAEGGFAPQAAPGGEEIFYAKGHDVPGIWRVAVNGGREQQVLAQTAIGSAGLWALASPRVLLHMVPLPNGEISIAQLDVGTNLDRTLAKLSRRPLLWDSGFSLAPDGEHLIYSTSERDGSDLILVEE